MPDDQYSLSNLRDIVVPEPPPVWPLATGAWLAFGVAFVLIVLAGWRIYSGRKRNAYRNAGLALLSKSNTAQDISIVLKRVALAAFPREQVASLYGDEWAAFLNMTCPQRSFEELVGTEGSAPSSAKLVTAASTWIRCHRVSESDRAPTRN